MRRVLTVSTACAALALAAAGCGSSGGTNSGSSAPPPTVSASGTAGSASPSPTPQSTKPAWSAKISKVAPAMVADSWHKGCPVPVSGLRMITMPYWGMDGKAHSGGQLVVNASAAAPLVKVFHKLWKNHYPIHKMVPVEDYKGSDYDSIEADNTSAFNCRNATGSSSFSQHAYGLAVDLNPCENPYVDSSGHIDHPKCVKFGDRSRKDPGLIHAGDSTVRAFASIGWGWGGNWNGIKDFQHFSSNGH